MAFPEKRFLRFIEYQSKGIVGTFDLVDELLSYQLSDKLEAIAYISNHLLPGMEDFLRWYPSTDLGWGMLPESAPVVTDESLLNMNELADIRRLPTRSVRLSVEELRTLIRTRLEMIDAVP